MKTTVTILTVAVALSLFGETFLRAQSPEDPGSLPAVQETLARVQAERQAQDRAQQEIEIARQQVERAQKQVAQIAPRAAARAAYTDRLQATVRRAPGGAGKALVIRSAETDPKEQANLEEDLAVMSHIFDKAIDEKLGGERHAWKAMGINVFFTPASNPLRSLYLDGYGALFMLNVSFPLLPPPARTEAHKENPPVDSAWQEARDELYGQHPVGKTFTGLVEEYDQEKVNKLKDALLEALKNAANIRNLKSDDSITICVFGGASTTTARSRAALNRAEVPGEISYEAAEGAYDAVAASGAPVRASIMTIRVKRSDVEAFAKGKLNLEEFRKKARSATYAGALGSGRGNSPFNFGGGDGSFSLPPIDQQPPNPFDFGAGGGAFGESP